ncbi:MAG: co-chaperone GroES family protein [Bacteroidales bacterium]|nr:co-chaperone GroES family protein [Bacteroidales bacterium]
MNISRKSLSSIYPIGDRVLISLAKESSRTKSGLLLPPGYSEKEEVLSGFVVKVGPGYPIPFHSDSDDEIWKQHPQQSYIPLQVKEGDFALFLKQGAIEVVYNDNKFFVVNQSNILLIERDDT